MKRVLLLLLLPLFMGCQSDWGPWIKDNWFGIDRDEPLPPPVTALPSSAESFLIERAMPPCGQALDDPLKAGFSLRWGSGWCAAPNSLGVPVPDELWFDPDGPSGALPEQPVSLADAALVGSAEVTAVYPAPGEYLATARIRTGTRSGCAQLLVTVPQLGS